MAGRKISITEMDGFRIGNAQDYDGMTGVTVVLLDAENKTGIDISGGGPATREAGLCFSDTADHSLHAIVLAGGSAFGLDASSGVVQYLKEHNIGYPIVKYRVPLVCQSGIFDLGIGADGVYPDAKMGYEACVDAERNHPASGIIGAGTGATVGKLYGIRRGTKTGIGYAAMQIGKLQIGAIAVVNSWGDVRDPATGKIIAGLMDEDRKEYIDMVEEMVKKAEGDDWDPGLIEKAKEDPGRGNTTLGIILTNADFSKNDMIRVAKMARAAFGRCIAPVGTPADGDTIYAVSLKPGISADISYVGTFAAKVFTDAILDAVKSADMDDQTFLDKINI